MSRGRYAPEVPIIYFVQAGTTGPIKIGYARKSVGRRIKTIATSSSQPLGLLGIAPGSRKTEAQWHRCFRKDRLHGEWFRPSPGLFAAIEKYARIVMLTETLEDGSKAEYYIKAEACTVNEASLATSAGFGPLQRFFTEKFGEDYTCTLAVWDAIRAAQAQAQDEERRLEELCRLAVERFGLDAVQQRFEFKLPLKEKALA